MSTHPKLCTYIYASCMWIINLRRETFRNCETAVSPVSWCYPVMLG